MSIIPDKIHLRGRVTMIDPFALYGSGRGPSRFKATYNVQGAVYAAVWAAIKERGIGYDPYDHYGSRV